MTRTTPFPSLGLITALGLAAACGAESQSSNPASPAGGETVIDPVGTSTELDPEHPEPIDRLAEALSEPGTRVDLGEHFTREAVGEVAGRRLIVGGATLETWTFDEGRQARTFAARFSTDGRLFDGERLPWTEVTHLWTWGPMVLMYLGDDPGTLAALDEAADRLTSHPGDETAAVAMGPAAIEARVRDAALERFAFGGQTPLTLVTKERAVFDDACLEVPRAAEVCQDVDTPGWRLVFAHGDDRLVAHTDIAASRIFWRTDS